MKDLKSDAVVKVRMGEFFAPSAFPNAKAHFGRVFRGQPNVYDTPFAKGESTEHMLREWNKTLISIKDKWPSLYQFETDMQSKVGPLSVMKPLKDRIQDIQQYYEGILLPSNPIDPSAIKAVISEFNVVRGIGIRTTSETIKFMKKSSNSGTPYFTKRRNVLESGANLRILQHSTTTDGYTNAAILGWRGQEGGYSKDDVKQRVVWMFPFSVNVQELRVYQPLIEMAQRHEIVPAWVSMECVDHYITKLFDTKAPEDLVVCTDFTKFDQHFNQHLVETAADVLRSVFNSTINGWLEDVFPIKYNIPMLISNSQLVKGRHGMGSGSGGTNADETLAHRALQYEAARKIGSRLNPNSQCLGDDGILSYPGITVEDVVRCYSAHGLEMNTSKQYASTQDCVYLRRWHHEKYRINHVCAGVYSTMRALGRLRYLERYMDPRVWGPKAVALRQLSILENVKYHPLREQFAEFCMKRDKYRLGIDIPGFLTNIEDEVKRVVDYMPDFMGYVKTLQNSETDGFGIRKWWIYQYLMNYNA
ncbi:RNA-dependent RNA polymerase [Marmot picobirnavirus]|nr:RNA-dependent RNA polymerase [Marmot picobirnavirus]